MNRLVPIAALALLVPGCRSPDPALPGSRAGPAFSEIRFGEATASEDGSREDCPVAVAVVAALSSAEWDFGPGRASLSLVLACMTGPAKGSVEIRVAATVTVHPPGEAEEEFDGLGSGSCATCGQGREPFTLLRQAVSAVREALTATKVQAILIVASDEEVVRVLSSPQAASGPVLLTALEEAGERRLDAAVPAILPLLKPEATDVVLRAIGCLGRIGNPAAIRPLGKLGVSGVPQVPHVALRAITDIGGPEASRTLEFVAEQSPDPLIQREARRLLEEAEKGRGE
jgi:hypothetical protein